MIQNQINHQIKIQIIKWLVKALISEHLRHLLCETLLFLQIEKVLRKSFKIFLLLWKQLIEWKQYFLKENIWISYLHLQLMLQQRIKQLKFFLRNFHSKSYLCLNLEVWELKILYEVYCLKFFLGIKIKLLMKLIDQASLESQHSSQISPKSTLNHHSL